MMMEFLASISDSELSAIADALKAGRIRPPFSAMSFQQVVPAKAAAAASTVLVVGFAMYQGQRVFAALADRMTQIDDLHVRLFLDVARERSDTSLDSGVLRRFADRFVNTQWPAGHRLPVVYYYPPSVQVRADRRASLHANTTAQSCPRCGT